MKQVKVRITGTLVIVDYCSQKVISESEDFTSNYYITGGWDSVDSLYVNDNEEENLVKKKGKYVKTREYFHDLFKVDGEHPLPVEIHYKHYEDQELEYVIMLEDDEEFDIKKVQLVKSDYEIELFPYFILCDHILYDGKEIQSNDDYNAWGNYCPEDKMYNEATVYDFCYD